MVSAAPAPGPGVATSACLARNELCARVLPRRGRGRPHAGARGRVSPSSFVLVSVNPQSSLRGCTENTQPDTWLWRAPGDRHSPRPSPPQLGASLRGHKDEQLRSGGEVEVHPEVPGSPESVPWRASATGTPQRPGQCRGQGLRTGGDWAAACDARLGSRWPLIGENRISGRSMSPGTLHCTRRQGAEGPRSRVRRPVLWSEHCDFATR